MLQHLIPFLRLPASYHLKRWSISYVFLPIGVVGCRLIILGRCAHVLNISLIRHLDLLYSHSDSTTAKNSHLHSHSTSYKRLPYPTATNPPTPAPTTHDTQYPVPSQTVVFPVDPVFVSLSQAFHL